MMKRALLILGCVALVLLLLGNESLLVLQVLATSSFGSLENLSYTLFYATPMLLTGTAVAIALKAGLFNIGAEGQLYMGAVCAAGWGVLSRGWLDPSHASHLLVFLTLFGAAIASFSGGALWGGIAGYLKTHRQTHEVIATILLNFIAMAFANWVVLNPLKNPETQNLETIWIAEPLRIPPLWQHTTIGLPLALAVAIAMLWALQRTWWGFRIRATGENETAAHIAGIRVKRTALGAMVVSGAIAGLVGFHEVYLNSYRLIDAFSPGYGFTGLAIALLARGNPIALIGSAIFFGALHKGSLDLDLETEKVTRDLAAVIQALLLVVIAASAKTRKA